jgi:hypothetical protein
MCDDCDWCKFCEVKNKKKVPSLWDVDRSNIWCKRCQEHFCKECYEAMKLLFGVNKVGLLHMCVFCEFNDRFSDSEEE